MAAVSKFLLLQLPQEDILGTIRLMDIYQKISFSLISKRCKGLIQSLQIKAKFSSVSINNDIRMFVTLPEFTLHIYFANSTMRNDGQKKILRAPLYVSFDFSHHLKRIGFKYNDWLEHFQTIFHCPSIANIQFYYGSSEYDLDEIREVFGATKKLYARDTGCYANNLMIFQKFSLIENLNIRPDMFQDSRIPFNILQQNYATLDIICDFNNTKEMTLDQLLVINSKIITMENIRISPQDLSTFIKLWMKGSNPRLENLNLFRTDSFSYDSATVMKGIKRKEIKQGKQMEVYRRDGTCATILFGAPGVQMFVWFD
ncbi:hypothetical protein CAEBREN_19840 [Caenorhabditis brenneri]|uniref:F-box domain-containing protein n=1 Tax=Caenorhabditis brenneri TaxID=135651 RepID=G0N0I1_CAEBE|nr:hypothetical protein CAEBREN_19840 [Caenorhabditis brenneri]